MAYQTNLTIRKTLKGPQPDAQRLDPMHIAGAETQFRGDASIAASENRGDATQAPPVLKTRNVGSILRPGLEPNNIKGRLP